MARATHDLLAEALELPPDERAMMAAELIESMDYAQEDVEATWATEIQSRAAQAQAGELESTNWRTILDRVEGDVLGG